MILDILSQSARYEALHPGFAPAFAHLSTAYAKCLNDHIVPELGRHTLDGERLQVIFERGVGRGLDGAKLEIHRRYIDIQLRLPESKNLKQPSVVAEVIGWQPLNECHRPETTFNSERDIQFFGDKPTTWLSLPAGTFAIFYPTDAHAPLAGEGEVLKAIYKIAVDW